MNDFVRQYAEFCGVYYPTQKIGDIRFHTGTRVYRCTKIKDHLSRAVHIFGRWVKIIYNGQPARQKKPSDKPEQRETEQQEQDVTPDERTNLSPTIIEKTPIEDMPRDTSLTNALTKRHQKQVRHRITNNINPTIKRNAPSYNGFND